MPRLASAAFAMMFAASASSCAAPPPRRITPTTTEERFGAELAEAACSGVASCCGARHLGAFDPRTCEALVRGTLDGMQRLKQESGGGALDPRAAAACLAKVKAYAGTCVDPEQAIGSLDAMPCDALFSGGLAAGKTCQTSEQCGLAGGATRAICGEAHTCEALAPAASGASCVGDCDADGCSDAPKGFVGVEPHCDARQNLTCDADTDKCRARAAVGETCDKKRACAVDAFCRDGHCASKGGLGASCASAADACAAELTCDRGSKTCVAKKANGAACSADADCTTANCAGRTCRSRTDATMLRLGRGLRLFCASE